MGLGFLTLGVSIDFVLCPGCPALPDWCVVHSKDGDVQWFAERMSWRVQRRLRSQEKVLAAGQSRAESQCQRHLERWLIPARRQIAANVWSVHDARVDPSL